MYGHFAQMLHLENDHQLAEVEDTPAHKQRCLHEFVWEQGGR